MKTKALVALVLVTLLAVVISLVLLLRSGTGAGNGAIRREPRSRVERAASPNEVNAGEAGAEETDPKSDPPEDGSEEKSDAIPAGYLLVGGVYMPPPYDVTAQDFAVYVNGVKVFEVLPAGVAGAGKQEDGDDLSQLTESERRIALAEDMILDNYPKFVDFYGDGPARSKLISLLNEHRKERKVPRFRFGEDTVTLFAEDGVAESEVFLDTGEPSLGPPYRQYDPDTAQFVDRLEYLVREAHLRYTPKEAAVIAANFLSSQKAIDRYDITGDSLVVVSVKGEEVRMSMRDILDEDFVREDPDAEFRAGAIEYAQQLGKYLNEGALLIVRTGLDGQKLVPPEKARGKVKAIVGILSDDRLTVEDRVARMAALVGPSFARELVARGEEAASALRQRMSSESLKQGKGEVR